MLPKHHILLVIRVAYDFEHLTGTGVVIVTVIIVGFFSLFEIAFATRLVVKEVLLLLGPAICVFRSVFIITF